MKRNEVFWLKVCGGCLLSGSPRATNPLNK
jgi:hypothetical protein